MTAAAKAARVAVLGTGAVAQVVHLPILTRMRGVEVVGLHDTDHSKASTIAERFSVPQAYATPEEMWGDPGVDAVVVCTPNNRHEEQVAEGLSAGKYVFCEKPLALTADGAARVLEASGADGRLMVGMNQRFRPDATALRSFVTAGDMGEVHYLRASWLNRRAGRTSRNWRHRKEGAGGGALMDLGIQILDLSLWLLDYPEPRRLVAHLRFPPGGEVEDSAVILLELEGGRVVNLDVSWTLIADRERQHFQILGTQGSASFAPLKVFRDTENGLLDVSPQLSPGRENVFTASYRQELAHFTEAVRSATPIDAPVEQVTLMRIVEAAYRSAEKGKEVSF
jgi:predicted dehydrogenase